MPDFVYGDLQVTFLKPNFEKVTLAQFENLGELVKNTIFVA